VVSAGADAQRLPPGVDANLLARAVGGLLGAEHARLNEWWCRSIWEPRVTYTRGVYLCGGTASVAREERKWAVVLKILASTQDGTPPLESYLYGSGFLGSLSGGLVAPRCLGVDTLPVGDMGVWLEHVTDTIGPAWPIERFGVMAYHLGEFSGAQTPDGELPDWPWLRRGDLRGAVAERASNVDALRTQLDHPLVRRAYPPDVADGFLGMWEEREVFLSALDRVPHVVCHGDAQRRNVFARDVPGADQRTVAVDWTNMRAWQAGTDAKTLVHQALMYFDAEVDSVWELDAAVFRGYMDGLSDAGWRGEEAAVRMGYVVQMALGSVVLEIGPSLRMSLDESLRPWYEAVYGRPVEEILERRAGIGRFVLGLIQEVRSLL